MLEMGEASVVAFVGDGQGIVLTGGESAQIVTPDLDFDLGEAFEVPGVTGDGGDEDLARKARPPPAWRAGSGGGGRLSAR